MSNKDLINLGYSPDSGTGDSARRGGEKINNLFADIYTQFGDNPVGQDPSQPFYGYRRPFYEYEYKVGELHPSGRFIPIKFKTTKSYDRLYNEFYGWGYNSTGSLVDSDNDGIPSIYRDSEWYFLSRGEAIEADFTEVDSDSQVHFVLPLAAPGDTIIIRDGFGTWNDDNNRKNILVSFWTTPYDFQSLAQVQEWEQATKLSGRSLDSDTISVYDPLGGNTYRSNWRRISVTSDIEALYPKLDQPFAVSRTTLLSNGLHDGLSPTFVIGKRRYQYEFLFTNYEEGWIFRTVALESADVSATIELFGRRIDAIDSDLATGIYVSADSDILYSVPLFTRDTNNAEVHGNIAFKGNPLAIQTRVDSEAAFLTDGKDGSIVKPKTTTIRFDLTDDVTVRRNLTVGNNAEVHGTFIIGGASEPTFVVDSDLTYLHNKLQVKEKATFDSDVEILGQLLVHESSQFNSDVRFMKNIWIDGDSTAIATESLRVKDNIITLSKDANNAPLKDTGLIFQRYDRSAGVNGNLTASNTVFNTTLVWNEADEKFKFGETVSSDSEQTITFEKTYFTISRNLVEINNDLTMGGRLQIENTFVIDSDLLSFNDSDGVGILTLQRETLDRTYDEGDQSKNINDNTEYTLRLRGNAVFGKDSDDVVVFNSRIMSNLIPYGPEIYNLGDSDNPWKDLHLAGNTIHLGAIKLKESGGSLLIVDSDDNVINLTGADFSSSNLNVDSEVTIGGNSLLLGELHVQEHAQFDSDVIIAGNLTVGDHVELGGHVRMLESLTVDSDVFFSADLRVDSDVYIKGDVEIREDLVVIGELYVDDNVYFGHKLTVDSDVRFGSDLQVDSDAIIKGELYVGENVQIHDTLYVKGHATFDSDVTIAGGVTFGREVTFEDDVLFLDNATFDSDVLIRGALTVNGATTFVNSNNLQVFDNFIVLNKGQASPFNDTGLIFTRFDSDSVSAVNYNAIFEWDEATESYLFGETSSSGLITNPPMTATYFSVGNAPSTTAPFVIDVSGASDPGGAPAGYTGPARPTLTGNGTGVIDGGTF